MTDFIGLPVTTISPGIEAAAVDAGNPLRRDRLRNSTLSPARLRSASDRFQIPVIKQEMFQAARFLLAPTPAAATPGLLDGYGFNQPEVSNVSAAAQVEWSVTDRLRLPWPRFNYDQKDVDFDQQVYGGLQTTDPELIALQRSILAPQAYKADVSDTNTSGQITLAYKIARSVNAYGTYATGFKSVGLNLNGVPTDALNRPVLSAAAVKPEDVHNIEVGVKTEPFPGVTANIAVYDTEIKDFQAQVTNGSVGVIRGYLANAEKVRVRGVEFDGSARVSNNFSLYAAVAYTDGKYVSFPDAPPPLEETADRVRGHLGPLLPGISKWALSVGGEYAHRGSLLNRSGQFFGALDTSYRSSFSSSASYSKYLVVEGYPLLNARFGFRWSDGWTVSIWSRNLLNQDYFDLLTAAPGNTGLYVGQPGDPRTYGVTLRMTFKSK